MLVHQGARMEIWTGASVDAKVMYTAAELAISGNKEVGAMFENFEDGATGLFRYWCWA